MSEDTPQAPIDAPREGPLTGGWSAPPRARRRLEGTGTWIVLGGAVLLDLGDPTDLEVYRTLKRPTPSPAHSGP
jgi:hypothetical protein